MYQYLGVRLKFDKEGCLQDIHWLSGWFGYFPAYTLGAIIASMLGSTLDNTVMSEVAKGNFYNINEFLNKNIWGMGSLKDTNNLIKEDVGEDAVNPNIFLAYLENKYQE
jgi:carboxypeptidase Taq